MACTHGPGSPKDGAPALQEGDVFDVLTFDPSVADFYWYGHRLEPPVKFTLLAQWEFRANGIAPVHVPYDTAGSSAMLAPLYGRIPLVDSLVKHGSSYLEALNAMGRMAIREPRLCIQAYRQHRTEGDSSARAAALGTLTPGLWDAAERVEIDANRFSSRMVTGTPIHIVVSDTAGVSLAEDPFSPHPRPDSVLWARQIVAGWRATFAGRRNVVLIATLNGSETCSGTSADRARREIANARAAYRQGGMAALESVATTSMVSRQYLEQIAGTEQRTPP